MSRKKKKYSLIATMVSVERFHERRSMFVVHATLSLIFQAAMWLNWYTSYTVRGLGFEYEFFGPRLTLSTVMVIFLVGHFTLMRLRESRDRLIIRALQRDEDENDRGENDDLDEYILMSDDEPQRHPDEADYRAAKLSR
jgi:hypothetical protein